MAPFLDLEHLYNALKGFKRPSCEGREAIENLVAVGKSKVTDEEATVEALCVRTTKIDEPPCKLKEVINRKASKVEEKISEVSCSCPAGASLEHVCKHVFALLMYLERHDENELNKLTCTDLEQIWGTLKEDTLSRFSPAPLHEFCHVSKPPSPYKRSVAEVTEEMAMEFRAMFLANQPESEAAIFLSGVREPPLQPARDHPLDRTDLNLLRHVLRHSIEGPYHLIRRTAEIGEELLSQCTPQEQAYYKNNCVVTLNESLQMCVDTVGQDNELWMLFKRGRITGSISYSMFTYTKNTRADWDKRFSASYNNDDSFHGNANTERGLIFEDDARQRYMGGQGDECCMVQAGIFVHPLLPWAGFSPDGILVKNKEPVAVWENKTPKKGLDHNAEELVHLMPYFDKKRDRHLKKKHDYYGQVQLDMVLFNLPVADFTVYSVKGDNVHVDRVPIDDSFLCDFLESLCKMFFKKLLPWLVKNPPKNG